MKTTGTNKQWLFYINFIWENKCGGENINGNHKENIEQFSFSDTPFYVK